MTPSASPSILPPLSADEAGHCAAVERLVRDRVAAGGGWLSFESFMELVLYTPGLGYYSAGAAKLGAAGDFVTAPELSSAFSRCVAQQCAEILAVTGGDILEFGAGSGRMAAVILERLATLNVLPQRYWILEVSADLRSRQAERIGRLPGPLRDRVVWLDRLPATPLRGVILANEVLDALPCHRFTIEADGAHLLGVSVDATGKLIEQTSPPHDRSPAAGAVRMEVARRSSELAAPLPVGYRSELCLRVAPWVASLADQLEHGAALLFDYGLPRAHYYHPQRSAGTMRCHFKQRAHDDPLINVGVQDITAWVDFTAVAEAALGAGLDALGFVTQAAFLLGTGIESLSPSAAAPVDQARWAAEVRQLLLPGEMGETFKVMALGRDYAQPLRGFALQDLRRTL